MGMAGHEAKWFKPPKPAPELEVIIPEEPDPPLKRSGSKLSASDEEEEELLREVLERARIRVTEKPASVLDLLDDDVPDDEEEKKAKRESVVRSFLSKITQSSWFQGVIVGAVIINALQMGVQVDQKGPTWMQLYQMLEYLFCVVFFVEFLFKLIAQSRNYFRSYWNLLDFVLVSVSIVDIVVIPVMIGGDSSGLKRLSILRVLRLLRIVRVARIFKFFKELWLVLKGVLESFRTLMWVSLLLVVVLYVCAIFCTQMIGQSPPETYATFPEGYIEYGFEKEFYFGSIVRSMMTLFNIVILTGEYDTVMRAIVERQPSMFLFFLAFIMFTTFGLMNVIIGVVVDNVINQAQECDEEHRGQFRLQNLEVLSDVKNLIFAHDKDKDGLITNSELHEACQVPGVREKFDVLGALPCGWDTNELFWNLNLNGDMEITNKEFLLSMMRMVEHNKQQELGVLLSVLHQITFLLSRPAETVEEELRELIDTGLWSWSTDTILDRGVHTHKNAARDTKLSPGSLFVEDTRPVEETPSKARDRRLGVQPVRPSKEPPAHDSPAELEACRAKITRQGESIEQLLAALAKQKADSHGVLQRESRAAHARQNVRLAKPLARPLAPLAGSRDTSQRSSPDIPERLPTPAMTQRPGRAAGSTPRNPVQLAVLRQVQCLQDYATKRT
jgi:voltage-gated sodium channel